MIHSIYLYFLNIFPLNSNGLLLIDTPHLCAAWFRLALALISFFSHPIIRFFLDVLVFRLALVFWKICLQFEPYEQKTRIKDYPDLYS